MKLSPPLCEKILARTLHNCKSWALNNKQHMKNYTHLTPILDYKLFVHAMQHTYETFISRCTQTLLLWHCYEHCSSMINSKHEVQNTAGGNYKAMQYYLVMVLAEYSSSYSLFACHMMLATSSLTLLKLSDFSKPLCSLLTHAPQCPAFT